MVIRLIGTIIIIVIMAFFVGFNLDNKCNVNLLFKTFENVPVFITIMISFATGIIFTLPVALSFRHKKAKKEEQKKEKKEKKSLLKKAENISDKTTVPENTQNEGTVQSAQTDTDSESDTGSAI